MVLQRLLRIHCAGLILCLAAQPELEPSMDGCQNRSCNDPNAGDDSALLQKRTTKLKRTRKAGSQENGAGQRWHPQIYEYIQYLEDLEAHSLHAESTLSTIGSSLLEEGAEWTSSGRSPEVRRRAPNDVDEFGHPRRTSVAETSNGHAMRVMPPTEDGNITTAFIVMSDSNNYNLGFAHNRLAWIAETWGKDLPKSQLLSIGDDHKAKHATKMPVRATRCPAHTHDGACCKEGEAVIAAQRLLQKQPNLNWAYIVDDDAYVRAEAMDRRLKKVDPIGMLDRGTLVAMRGCGTKECPGGVCGGGGMALSREALKTLVGDRPSKFLKSHMETCNRCGMWGDVSMGTEADANNITVYPVKGMHGWFMPKNTFDSTLYADDEPLMYHYQKMEGQHRFLDQLFANSSAEQKMNVEDLTGPYCATYGSNVMCTSDPSAVPWSLE